MIDIPPYIEQMIIAKAEQQGISVDELLLEAFDDDGIYFDIDEMEKAMNSPTVRVPDFDSVEALMAWMRSDFGERA